MKRLLVAGIAAAAFLSAPALAVDVPQPAPVHKTAPAPMFNWTGYYIGGFLGGAWAGSATTTDPCSVGAGGCFNGVTPTTYHLSSSFIGGGTTGVNWQMRNSPFVFGLENEYGYLRVHGSALQAPGVNDTLASTKIGDWYDAYTVRLGYAWDRSLLYAKIGGVSAKVTAGVVDTTGVTVDTTASKTVTGFAAGGGWEYAFAPNWSAKIEYLFLGLNKTVQGTSPVVVIFTDFSNTSLSNVNTVKVGLNYRFGSQ